MVMATAIITKQQSGILSSVFNFAGLLLILDLDELAASITSFTVTIAKCNTDFAKFNSGFATINIRRDINVAIRGTWADIIDLEQKKINVDICETNADINVDNSEKKLAMVSAVFIGLFIYLLV